MSGKSLRRLLRPRLGLGMVCRVEGMEREGLRLLFFIESSYIWICFEGLVDSFLFVSNHLFITFELRLL